MMWPSILGMAIGALVVLYSLKTVALIGGLVTAALMAISPAVAFGSIIATIPVNVQIGGMTVAKTLLPLALFAIFTNASIGRCPWPSPFQKPAGLWALGFFIVVAVSAILAGYPHRAFEEANACAVYAAIFFTSLAFVRTEEDLRRLAILLVVVGVAEAGIGIAQYYLNFVLPGDWRAAHEALEEVESEIRVEGTSSHPIVLAGFFQTVIPFGIALLLASRRALVRVVLAGCIALMAATWVTTFSRSSMIAVAAMLVFTLALGSRLARVGSLVCVVLGLSVLAAHEWSIFAVIRSLEAIPMIADAFGHRLYAGAASFQFRIESWAGGINLFLAHPFDGVGMGQAKHSYLPYLPNWAISPVHPTEIHNVFIEAAAELGFLGLLCFVALWIWAFRCVGAALKVPELRLLARTLQITLFGQLVFLMFTPMVREVWLTLALAAAVGRIAESHRAEEPTRYTSLKEAVPA